MRGSHFRFLALWFFLSRPKCGYSCHAGELFFFFFFLQKQAPIYLGGKSPISWIKFLHYNDTELMTYTTLIHFLEGSTDRYFENRNRNRKCDSFWHQDASKSRTGPRLKAAPEFVHSEVAKWTIESFKFYCCDDFVSKYPSLNRNFQLRLTQGCPWICTFRSCKMNYRKF